MASWTNTRRPRYTQPSQLFLPPPLQETSHLLLFTLLLLTLINNVPPHRVLDPCLNRGPLMQQPTMLEDQRASSLRVHIHSRLAVRRKKRRRSAHEFGSGISSG